MLNIKSVNTHKSELDQIVIFNWDIVDACQYQCSYCYSTDLNKQNTVLTGPHLNSYKIVLHLLKQYKFQWGINIQGGEPTLHPNIIEIVKTIANIDNCKYVMVSTNLTAKMETYSQLNTINNKVSIHVSYHPEYSRHFIKRMLSLKARITNINIFVEVILFPKKQYFNQMLDIIRQLEQYDIKFGVNLTQANQYWDGITDEGFYSLFQSWLLSTETPLIKHTLTDNSMQTLNEHTAAIDNIIYKNLFCLQTMYHITPSGEIFNICTKCKIGISVDELKFKKYILCPSNTPCPCSEMFSFIKKDKLC